MHFVPIERKVNRQFLRATLYCLSKDWTMEGKIGVYLVYIINTIFAFYFAIISKVPPFLHLVSVVKDLCNLSKKW